MDRRPKWPIALGLVLWGGAGVLAYYDQWWPLIFVAVVSLAPGLGIGAMMLFTRRAQRDAGAVLEAQPATPSDEPVAEPPRPRQAVVRTNAKTAGRRRPRGGATGLLVLVGALATEGCEKIERARAERRARETADDGGAIEPATTDAPPRAPTPGAPAAATTSTADPALAAALAHAITPPPVGEATWEVDPFVAALVFERVRAGAPPRFTPITAPIPEGPSAGFRVDAVEDGSLFHRLGLRTGDVIEAIGGVLLTDASRVGFALDGAQNRVDVTVFRDGMSVVQRYRLTTGLAWSGLLAGFTGDPAAAAIGTPAVDPDAPATDVVDVAPGGGTTPVAKPSGGSPGGTTPSSKPGGGTQPGGIPKPGGGSNPGGSSPPTSGGTTPGSDPVQCESAAKCTITKAYFDKMVGSPSALQSQANIVPAIQNDVHSGYKLKSVKAGSSVAKLGFRAGDKITHINGSDLTDEFQAAALYMGLSGTSVFKIRYVRGASSSVKTVVVK